MTNLILLSVLSLLHADPQPKTTSEPAPASAARPAAQPAAAQVMLRVTVRKDGQPFAGVPLGAAVGAGALEAYAATDAMGVAVLPVTLSGENLCRIEIAPRWPASAGPLPAAIADPEARVALTRPWTWAGPYVLQLDATTPIREFQISVYPKRTVTVPLQIGNSPARFGTAFVGWRPPSAEHDSIINGGAFTFKEIGGRLELVNVPRSGTAFAYIGATMNRSEKLVYQRVEIPAGEPAATLPPVTVDPNPGPTGTALVTLNNLGSTPFRGIFSTSTSGLTFVSADGSNVVDAPAVRDATWPRSVSLPSGQWYLTPGVFTFTQTQLRLIERLRAGEDLTSTPIPKIVITEGATVTVNADAAAIERAIMGIPEPAPVVPPAPLAPLPRSVNATVRVTVRKNGEPFVGVPIGGGVSPTKYDSFAVTNELGVAVLSVPINDRPLCRVGIAGAGWPESAGPKPAALSSLPSSLQAFMAPWTFGEPICVPILGSQPIVDVQMTVYPVRVVQMPVLVGNEPAKHGSALIGWKPPESQYSCSIVGSPRIGANGSLRIESAPQDGPAFAYIQAAQSRDRTTTQHFRAEIPAGPPGAQLSAFIIPDSPGPTGTLRITLANRANSPFARVMSTASGIALVSADGSRVVSAVPVADAQGQPVWPLVVTVPVGTWYLAPSIFTGNNVQLRLIDRLRSGEALLATAIPRVVVGAGTNADVNADAGSLERAIMGIPEPAPVVPPAPPAPPPANPGG